MDGSSSGRSENAHAYPVRALVCLSLACLVWTSCGKQPARQRPSRRPSPIPATVDWNAVWQRPAPVPDRLLRISRLQGIIWSAVVEGKAQRKQWVVFTENRVSFRNGCNRAGGDVKWPAPGRIRIGGLSSTLVACDGPQPRINLEPSAEYQYRIQGNQAELRLDTGPRPLILVAPPLVELGALVGRWLLAKTSSSELDGALARDRVLVSLVIQSTGQFELATRLGEKTIKESKGLLNRGPGQLLLEPHSLSGWGMAGAGIEAADRLTSLAEQDPEYRLEGDFLFLRAEGVSMLLARQDQ